MRLFLILTLMTLVVAVPMLVDAASIMNRDNEVHQIKGRRSGGNWVYVEINPNGTKYFNCRHGCELVLEKTGSSVELDTDGDVVIRNGMLTVR